MIYKKLSTFFCVVLLLETSIFAKKLSEPEWLKNYNKIYPDSTYIAQQGIGVDAEMAKNDAVASISRYFQSKVSSNIATTFISMSDEKNGIQESSKMIDEVSVQSEVDLFAVEFTEPFYVKKEKKWYCVAYINRDKAWDLYESQIKNDRNVFLNFYAKAHDEKEPFYRYAYYKKALISGQKLLEKLEYGRLLNPKKEQKYAGDRNVIGTIPVTLAQEIKDMSFSFRIENDYANTIDTAVKHAFVNSGFSVADNGIYNVISVVDSNESGDEPIVVYPSISLSVVGSDGVTVFSFQYKTEEKTAAFSLETAKKKAFLKFANILEKNIQTALFDYIAIY